MTDEKRDGDRGDGERLYDLQEAAEMLGKSEAALRMQIRRESIPAVKRPLDDTGRFKYVIAQSEIERERLRLRTSTRRADEPGPSARSTIADWRGGVPPTAPAADDVRQMVCELREKLDRVEREHRQEREDTRALIRSLENQVDLLKMMLGTVLKS